MEARFKIGMRTVKTVVAVAICMVIMLFFPVNAFYACIAAVICMQQTVEHTVRTGLNRMKGTVVGALLGIAGLLLQQHVNLDLQIVLAPVGVLLILYLCNIMKMPASCSYRLRSLFKYFVSTKRLVSLYVWFNEDAGDVCRNCYRYDCKFLLRSYII